MLEIDRPFDGLDEVWIWPVPHPDDPGPAPEDQVVTRIGVRTDATLVGHVALVAKRRKVRGGRSHHLVGLQGWEHADLGSLQFPNTDLPGPPGECTVRCGPEQASWRSGGVFRIGDHKEDNRIATGGAPIQGGLRELGGTAAALGRSLVRRVRKQDPEPDAPAEPEPAGEDTDELAAFDRWLVATPVDADGTVAWRVAIDRHPGAPSSVGLGLVVAAIGLVHARRLG